MAVTEASEAAADAVDDLFRRHGPEVYRYAFAVLGNHADAEDVTQTTFLNAYRALEQGVRARKPSSWLLTIASNAIKQRFRHESARPREVLLPDEIAESASAEDNGPSVGELLTALSRIPPQQRQAIVLREFEGRSYKEIAAILEISTSALETLLFRARRSLAEELEHQLTCTEAQLAVSRAADGRLGRKDRRRLREHLGECPDCARFARMQQRHRRALRGLVLLPVPVSFSLLRGLEGTATAAVAPSALAAGATSATVAAGTTTVSGGAGGGLFAGGGLLAGGLTVKAATIVTAATVVGGAGVVGVKETIVDKAGPPAPAVDSRPGARLGQLAPRGVSVPGKGVARGKPLAPGQRADRPRKTSKSNAAAKPSPGVRDARAKAGALAPKARPTAPAKKRVATERPNASGSKSADAATLREGRNAAEHRTPHANETASTTRSKPAPKSGLAKKRAESTATP